MDNSQFIIEDCLYLFVTTKGNAIGILRAARLFIDINHKHNPSIFNPQFSIFNLQFSIFSISKASITSFF